MDKPAESSPRQPKGQNYEHWGCDQQGVGPAVFVLTQEGCYVCLIVARRQLLCDVRSLEHQIERLERRIERLERENAALSDMVRNPGFAFEPIARSILSRLAAFVTRRV